MSDEPRPSGWYWVRYSGPPELALWDAEAGSWFVVGSEPSVPDDDVLVLSAKLEPPE